MELTPSPLAAKGVQLGDSPCLSRSPRRVLAARKRGTISSGNPKRALGMG